MQNTTFHFDECSKNSTLLPVREVYLWCLVTFIPVTILGNGLVCIVVLHTRKLRHQPLYIFLTSLAVADIFVGVIGMPTKAKMEWDLGCFTLPWFLCWVFRLGEVIFFIASTMHLLVITLDRYFAVKYTYEYKILMCRNTHLLLLLCVWVFAIVWSILSIFQWDVYYDFSVQHGTNGCTMSNRNFFTATYIALYVVPMCFIAFIYVFIYRVVVRHVVRTTTSQTDVSDTASLVVESYHKKRESVTLRSISIVFVTYSICWTPYVILTLAFPNDVTNTRHDGDSFTTLFVVADFLPSLDSAVKPFIYMIFNKSFLCSMQKLFRQVGRSKWMMGKYADMRRKRHTMPAYMADILYNEEEDNCFEMEVVPHDSPPRRRFTL